MNIPAKMIGLDTSHAPGELQRFTVQERLLWQRNMFSAVGCTNEEITAMWADHDALMLEHLDFMKFRRRRDPGNNHAFLHVIDWWPIADADDFEESMDAAQYRYARLIAFLAAGGGDFVVERMFSEIGKHIQKAAVAGNQKKLRAASVSLIFLARNFGAALDGCMAERRNDGAGMRLVGWAQARAEKHRLENESWENRKRKLALERQSKRKAVPTVARNKPVCRRRQSQSATVTPQA